jgi:Flp pilus assembly pilin Flp
MLELYTRLQAAKLRREEGQTMAEYAVILGVITAAVVAIFVALAAGIVGAVQDAINDMTP